MQTNTAEPMDASKQFCPNETCSARGQMGAGNIRIQSYQPQRSRCYTCKKTFSARRGTMMEGLRTSTELVVIVVIRLSYGCPVQAIVHAYGVDERTVAAWQKRAGKHCQHVHQAIVEQGKVITSHLQADEIRAKGRNLVVWMGMAIDATSRVWLEGVPKKHSAGLSRKSEKDGWERTMLFGSLASSLYCYHYQAYKEKTGGGSHAYPDTRTP